MLVNVQLPDAASLSRTEDVTKQLLEMVEQEPGVDGVTLVNGYAFMTERFCFRMARRYFIKLHDWDMRNALDGQHSAQAISQRINGRAATELPQAIVFAMGPPAVPGMGAASGFEFVLEDTLGRSRTDLAMVMNDVIAEANKRPEISHTFSTFRRNVPHYYVDIDRERSN